MECPYCRVDTVLIENDKYKTMSGRFWICLLECYFCGKVIKKKSVPVSFYKSFSDELVCIQNSWCEY